MEKQSFFITGTDTGIGKTYVACQLIRQYVDQGYRVIGMKPIAAGCDLMDGQWINEDVKLLSEASNVDAPLDLINPYVFKAPIAPHIAAEQEGVAIKMQVIKHAYEALRQLADIVIVEGAGGVLVPIDSENTIVNLIKYLDIPAILVVGMRLGCINHALLSYQVLQQQTVPLHGWVANAIDPNMAEYSNNLIAIERKLKGINRLL